MQNLIASGWVQPGRGMEKDLQRIIIKAMKIGCEQDTSINNYKGVISLNSSLWVSQQKMQVIVGCKF